MDPLPCLDSIEGFAADLRLPKADSLPSPGSLGEEVEHGLF